MILLFNIWFVSVRWIDVVDILLVGILLFQLYRLIRGTVAINIFIGILAFYMLWLIVKALDMELLGSILGQFIGVGVIALIVVFQQELRRFLLLIGTSGIFDKNRIGKNIFNINLNIERPQALNVDDIVSACVEMSRTKTGALIVIATKSDLKFFANTGELMDARLSKHLLESIFFKNNPLHDGAVIVSGNKIKAARCVLPVTENIRFPAHLGMRHRAAVGITEASDAIAVVVSEQTGAISFSREGQLFSNITSEKLEEYLTEELEKK